MKIALLADLHYGEKGPLPQRRCEIAPTLLKRAVARLNRLIQPDVVLLPGDLLNDGDATDAPDRLAELRTILEKLVCPYLVIPGNHDNAADDFYRVFDRPGEFMEIAGVRFVSFVDPEEPGYNARREAVQLERFHLARRGFDGPIVAVQHTCLFPPGTTDAPYNYTNAPEIIAAMRAAGIALSVSGHYHKGTETIRDGDITFVNAPALCEIPFPFLVITMVNGRIETRRHELSMPREMQLFDGHVHTQLAYCNDNMTVKSAIELAEDFGLAGFAFTEHSGQLYFSPEEFWGKTCYQTGLNGATSQNNRILDYLAMKQQYERDSVRFGLEADFDYQGNILIPPEDRAQFDYILGAVHSLPSLTKDAPPMRETLDTFLVLVEKMLSQEIDVLAHPFRIFRRGGWDTPEELFAATAQLLRKYGVASEINFHTNEPPVEFVRQCLKYDVKLSFGSDSHDLSELGDFSYHLNLLKQAGFDGDLTDVLLPR
ncbi:MAG: metallophosphoesterase [Phycisphaerae bacterium]|nr:metallophosphoesterase [Phycisphaerae bacterium]